MIEVSNHIILYQQDIFDHKRLPALLGVTKAHQMVVALNYAREPFKFAVMLMNICL